MLDVYELPTDAPRDLDALPFVFEVAHVREYVPREWPPRRRGERRPARRLVGWSAWPPNPPPAHDASSSSSDSSSARSSGWAISLWTGFWLWLAAGLVVGLAAGALMRPPAE